MASRLKGRPVSYNDSDSDSDAEPRTTIVQRLYVEADIATGLDRREDFCEAVGELTLLLKDGYQASSKAVQQLVRADVFKAVQALPVWSGHERLKECLDRLVQAAVRALPAAQRGDLQRQYKAACVAARRQEKRTVGHDPEVPPAVSHLPEDILARVMQHLDPIALAQAACVCREWAHMACCRQLWEPHCQSLLRKLEQSGQAALHAKCADLASVAALNKEAFSNIAKAAPAHLVWRARRVKVKGRLEWVDQAALPNMAQPPPVYLTPHMVHAHLLGRRQPAAACEVGSDSDEDDQLEGGPRFWMPGVLS